MLVNTKGNEAMQYWIEFRKENPCKPTGALVNQPKLPTENAMEAKGLIYRRLFAKGRSNNRELALSFNIVIPADAE